MLEVTQRFGKHYGCHLQLQLQFFPKRWITFNIGSGSSPKAEVLH
jgi:hypothetical protein